MTLFGQTAVRDGFLYGLGMAVIVPLGVVSVAVTTRYLPPAQYGRLAVLFSIASILTVIMGVGFSTGTMLACYGVGDGGDDDVGDVDGDVDGDTAVQMDGPVATLRERRRLLGSGVLIVTLVSGAVCVAVILLAPVIASQLAGGEQWTSAVRWMAVSAWAGSIWRVVQQVYRMERRAVAWSIANSARPILVVGATVAALVAGGGVAGVLMATALGTVAAILIAIAGSRQYYRFQPRRRDVSVIWSYGLRWVPLHIFRAIQSNVSTILLSLLAPAATVGLFQVANRIAQVPTFFGEGFLYAWVPLERAPIASAAKEHKGTRPFEAQIFLLLIFSTLGLVALVALTADGLVRIAAPAYSGAAALIPILAVAQALDLVYRGIYRATGFPLRRYWFSLLHVVWILPYAGVAALTVQVNPTYGVILAQVVAWVIVDVWMVRLDARGEEPTPFPWRRMALATLIAAGTVAAVDLLPDYPALHVIAATTAIVAFPLLLRATGVMTPYHVAIVRSIVSSVIPRRMKRSEVRDRLAAVPTHEREALVLVGCEGQRLEEAASGLGVAPSIVAARLVRGLRRFAGSPAALPVDAAIGEYVANRGTTLERDLIATHLREQGIDSLELHSLDETMKVLGRPARRGQQTRNGDSASSATPPLSRA
jgi:O-antigen/teichoic acid export membrane protein